MAASACLLLFFIYSVIFPKSASHGTSGVMGKCNVPSYQNFAHGAIVDFSSRVGMEERIPTRAVVEDLYAQAGRRRPLYMKTTRVDPARDTHASMPPYCIKPSLDKLKIGVPIGNSNKEFIYARNESSLGGKFTVTGFSIDVFNATLKHLPYEFPHEFVGFNGSYDSLVQQISYKKFDAVVADTAIVADRCQYAEFSQPYADPGLQILKYVKPGKFGRPWLFMKPFNSVMWALTATVCVYNGFVVWLIIERNHSQRVSRGNVLNQVGAVLSLAFTTLFSLNGDHRTNSNLVRLTMVVWLFVALVITQSYTASLASFLTTQKLKQEDINFESLIKSGVKVGCDGDSFVVKYLQVLGFSPANIVKIYSSEEYPQALRRGDIAAAFLEVPYLKAFLARNCRHFTTSKQIFKVGGFGFVFPKRSCYLPDISEAVLRVAESGQLRHLEDSMISSNKCATLTSEDGDQHSLGANSFWGLFVITSGTSTISLALFLFRRARDNRYRLLNTVQQRHIPWDDEIGIFAPDLDYIHR